MDIKNLYGYLLRAQSRDERLIVTFDEGDKYLLSSIDFCFSTDREGFREDEPLRVDFASCLSEPAKKLRTSHSTAGIWWTSTEPIEPVGMSYEVENVVKVFDDQRGYYVFHREKSDR